MRRQLLPALVMMIVFTVLLGLVYPLVVTGIALLGFNDKAEGALVEVDGQVVGSSRIGQVFTDPKYFHSRPSADGYVPGAQGGGVYSYGSNYGPLNPASSATCRRQHPRQDERVRDSRRSVLRARGDNRRQWQPRDDDDGNPVYEKNADGTFVCNTDTVPQRVLAYRAENGLAADVEVPVDAVTSSGSGLDPQISVANARLQAPRVAEERNMSVDDVLKLVDEHTERSRARVPGRAGRQRPRAERGPGPGVTAERSAWRAASCGST